MRWPTQSSQLVGNKTLIRLHYKQAIPQLLGHGLLLCVLKHYLLGVLKVQDRRAIGHYSTISVPPCVLADCFTKDPGSLKVTLLLVRMKQNQTHSTGLLALPSVTPGRILAAENLLNSRVDMNVSKLVLAVADAV